MKENELAQHITKTYFVQRIGIGVIAVMLPIMLYFIRKIFTDHGLQPSLSAYYYLDYFLRDYFVASLAGIGGFLIMYKGYHVKENMILNIAGLCALGVAFMPSGTFKIFGVNWLTTHGICAFGLFVCLAIVMRYYADKSLVHLPNERDRVRFSYWYKFLSKLMIALPLSVAFLLWVQGTGTAVFYLESFGVWVFSVYWFLKVKEFSISGADSKVLNVKAD